jgi:mannosylfructose-phosphate synthase
MISTHGYVAAHPPLGAPDTGGQVVYVLELSRKFAQLGYKVDIWTRRFLDQPETEPVDADVRILRVPCGGLDFIPKEFLYKSLPEWSEHALRYIRRHRLDYQFINSHYWDAGLAGQYLAGVLGIPHVHTPHSLGSWKMQQMNVDQPEERAALEKKFNFSRRIHHETILYRESDILIATTPPQVDLLTTSYGVFAEKIRMIPPGYDDNRFYPVSEATRQALRGRFGFEPHTVACVGRLAANKGFDLLIRAFEVVAKRQPEARLRLAVGEDAGEPQSKVRELKALVKETGLADRVTISGSISDEDLPDFYRAADVFALPSRYEPFGMTAIEAMACGTPTVITTNGGLYRAVTYGEHALYADSLDPEEFGITLLKPLRYPSIWSRLSRSGAHRVRSLFTWTGIGQQVLSAVEERDATFFRVGKQERFGW